MSNLAKAPVLSGYQYEYNCQNCERKISQAKKEVGIKNYSTRPEREKSEQMCQLFIRELKKMTA